jgi:GntR family transcriptional regulator, transcriptional repressor for pyruvate dehydrogenase complex
MSVPAYQVLAQTLRDQILSGQLLPGQRLPTEPELSEHYGVSRSTVREALRVLSSQDMIRTTRGVSGGSFVAHPRAEQISTYLEASLGLLTVNDAITVDSLLEVRDLVEGPAAELAALRATPDDLEAIAATLVDPADVEPGEMHVCNHRFHVLLIRAARNPLLDLLAQPVFRVLTTRFVRGEAQPDFWEAIIDDHRVILDALRRADPDAAGVATRAHLASLRSTYELIDRETRSESAEGSDRATLHLTSSPEPKVERIPAKRNITTTQ